MLGMIADELVKLCSEDADSLRKSPVHYLAGEPVRKLTERSAKLIYRYQTSDNSKMKLIQQNTFTFLI